MIPAVVEERQVNVIVRGCFECPCMRVFRDAICCSMYNDKPIEGKYHMRGALAGFPVWCPAELIDSGVIP